MVSNIKNKLIMALLIILLIVLIGFSIYFYYPEQVLPIEQGLLILFLTLLPFLVFLLLTSLDIKDSLMEFIKFFLFLLLPIIVLLIGVIGGKDAFNINVLNLGFVWYYIISVTWFGIGLLLFSILKE